MVKKTYNTPKRSCVIKARLTEEEKQDFEDRCRTYGLSQSEFIRQAVSQSPVKTTIRISPVNEETLKAFGDICAELGKNGSNLNQIAHYLNAGGYMDESLKADVKKIIGSLANLKYQILKEMGERIGNDQAYILEKRRLRRR